LARTVVIAANIGLVSTTAEGHVPIPVCNGFVTDAFASHDAAMDEAFVLSLVTDMLIESLDLRDGCRAAVLLEVHRARDLVFAWLDAGGRVRLADFSR
jgi:hypothetical protein